MTAPVIAVDRFPVDIIKPDGETVRTVKLMMTKPIDGVGRLKAWSAPDVVVLDVDFDLSQSDIRSKQVDWGVQTTDGVVMVRSAPGCGCGNRLKYWAPSEFQPMKMGKLR